MRFKLINLLIANAVLLSAITLIFFGTTYRETTAATEQGSQPVKVSPRTLIQDNSANTDIRTASGDRIPRAALLTERGRALVDQLRILRISESRMGRKHPSLKQVQSDIAAVKEQLEAWSPNSEVSGPLANRLPEMNDQDLRQLILRMSVKIERLEGRVRLLERKMQVF